MVGPSMRHGMRARRTAADHARNFGFGLTERASGNVGLNVRSDKCSAKIAGVVIHAITMAKKKPSIALNLLAMVLLKRRSLPWRSLLAALFRKPGTFPLEML